MAILFHTRESARVPPGRKSIVCSLRLVPGGVETTEGRKGGWRVDKLKWSGASALGDKQSGLSPLDRPYNSFQLRIRSRVIFI